MVACKNTILNLAMASDFNVDLKYDCPSRCENVFLFAFSSSVTLSQVKTPGTVQMKIFRLYW